MRHALFGFIVANLVYMGIELFGDVDWLNEWQFTPAGRAFTLVLMGLALVGILFFIIDSFVRQYDQERPLAIALAIVGLGFGLTTIFYYLRWGHHPVRFEFNDEFCEECLRTSSEYEGAPSLWTLNYVLGGRLVGASRRCPECGSTIRTHCFYLCGVPIYSAGSFRVQCPETNSYLLRKIPFHRPHLLKILAMPAWSRDCSFMEIGSQRPESPLVPDGKSFASD